MGKTIITIIVLAAVAVGGFYLQKHFATKKTDDTTKTPTGQVESGKKMSFGVFAAQGGSYECTVHQHINNVDTDGKVWLNNGLAYGEFDSVYNGNKVANYLIVRDGYTYTWSSLSPMGIKIPVSDSNNGGSASGSYSWGSEQIGDYDCVPWTANASKFVLPSSVTFSELSK